MATGGENLTRGSTVKKKQIKKLGGYTPVLLQTRRKLFVYQVAACTFLSSGIVENV